MEFELRMFDKEMFRSLPIIDLNVRTIEVSRKQNHDNISSQCLLMHRLILHQKLLLSKDKNM